MAFEFLPDTGDVLADFVGICSLQLHEFRVSLDFEKDLFSL